MTLMAAIWYYKLIGETNGPFTANQLREKASAGEITPDAWVRKGQDGKWTNADRVSGLFNPVHSSSSGADVPKPPKVHMQPPPVFPSSVVEDADRTPTFTEAPTTKTCPFCVEEIAIAARKCKHCGEFLDGTTSPSVSKTNTRTTSGPERTIKVDTAVKLLYATLGIGIIRSIIEVPRHAASSVGFVLFIMFSVFGLMWFLIYMIGKGRNWARITFLIMFILGVPLSILPMIQSLTHDPVSGILGLVQAAMQIIAIVLLFQGASSAWFKVIKQSKIENT